MGSVGGVVKYDCLQCKHTPVHKAITSRTMATTMMRKDIKSNIGWRCCWSFDQMCWKLVFLMFPIDVPISRLDAAAAVLVQHQFITCRPSLSPSLQKYNFEKPEILKYKKIDIFLHSKHRNALWRGRKKIGMSITIETPENICTHLEQPPLYWKMHRQLPQLLKNIWYNVPLDFEASEHWGERKSGGRL